MTREELQETYQRNRRFLEESEDSLRTFQQKGTHVVEQADARLRQSLNGIALTNEPLLHARRSYQLAESDYQEALAIERRQIHQQLDDLERDYQKAYRNLPN